jgi:hypothetical protein
MRVSLAPRLLLTILSTAPFAAAGHAQSGPVAKQASIMGGVGNSFGGMGGALEFFPQPGRLALLAGVGYFPSSSGVGAAFAGGMRVYTRGSRHQAYVEGGVAPLALSRGPFGDHLRYGPAFSLGYRYTGSGGFSVLLAGGAGWAPSLQATEPVLNLGFGYSWRR